ncbi:hypothetical protein ACFL39_01850 [Gemmatimonadota bacterium]
MNIRKKMRIIYFGIVLILVFNACSSPTKPNTALYILEDLQNIPAVPFPPETTDNSTIPAYLKTRQYCDQVAGNRLWLINLVQCIEEEQIPATKAGQLWQWQIPHSDGESIVSFEVTGTDTLYFAAVFQGPAYSSSFFSNPLGGWIHPESGRGMYWIGPDWSIGWDLVDTRVRFGSLTMGDGISIEEEINGGSLVVNSMSEALVVFEAQWDSLGHGSSSGIGSGDW